MNASEPLLKHREPIRDIKTGGRQNFQDKFRGLPKLLPKRCPVCRWHDSNSGFSTELWEPVVLMLREPLKWKPHKSQSTEARHWDGVVRSSAEVTVMVMERRDYLRRSSQYPTEKLGRRY